MNEIPEDDVQFKLRMDDEVETEDIAAQVGDLRLEKLSHRITLISILIPVLIVVILVMAYLDIKRRVVQTEDTGQLTAQTLSQDLESRFSNLSLGQAMIEEKLARLTDQTEQSIVKVQVNLKNLDDGLQKSNQSMASRKDVNRTTGKMEASIANVGQAVEELTRQQSELSASVQTRLEQLDEALSQAGQRTDQMEEKLSSVEQTKMDKAAMDLALKLEMLKLKRELMVGMDDLQARFKALEAKLDRLAARVDAQRSAAPVTPAPQPKSGTLKEQTIQ